MVDAEPLKELKSLYKKHGAREKLAYSMAMFWKIESYNPSGTLAERIQSARDAYEFRYLALAMLLLSNTDEARKYLKKSIKMDTIAEGKVILRNLNSVQKRIAASKEDLDKLRVRYRMGSLDAILVE